MADIKYHFIADGQASVRDAFRSIGDEARSSSKAISDGARIMRTSARESGRALTAQEKFAKDLAEAAKKAEKEDRKRAVEEAKAMRAYEREQERVAKHVAGIKDRHFRDQQKQNERTEAARRKEIAKETKDRYAHESRLLSIKETANRKNQENERKHSDRLIALRRDLAAKADAAAERDRAKEEAKSGSRKFDRELRQKQYDAAFAKRKKDIDERGSDGLKSSVRGAFIGGSAAVVASTLGVAGSAARQSLALHEISNRLSISARGAGEEAVDPAKLRKEFEQTAAKTPGISAMSIANAVQQFVTKTGRLDVARGSQDVFATVASATGSNVEDIAGAAADLFQKFDITKMEDMADAMAALAFQGKNGSFELKDAASQFARLSSAAARFGLGKGVEGVKVLGGLTQIAKESKGSPEEAATAIEAMFRQFVDPTANKKLAKLSGGGVNPFLDKGHTKTKDIRSLIVETITKAGGDQMKLQDIFNTEGIGAISSIITKFNEAKQTASVGGASAKDANEAGAQAARDYLAKMIDAPGDYAELQRDAAQAQQDASAKLSNAWEKIVAGLSDAAIPAITSFVETIENSPGTIEALIGTMENLIYFFGALVSATQDVLEYFGLVSKKVRSPEEKEADARKKAKIAQDNLDRFDKKRGGSVDKVAELQIEAGKLRKEGKIKEAVAKEKEADAMYKKIKATPEQDAERLKLVGELEHAKKNVGRAHGEVTKIQDQKQNIRSTDRFAIEYAAMLDQTDPSNKGANMIRAKAVAAEMQRGTFGKSYLLKDEKVGNESDEAFQFRTNQMQARRESAGVALGKDTSDASPAQLTAAMAKIETAAKALEQAAAAQKQATQTSIVPQP